VQTGNCPTKPYKYKLALPDSDEQYYPSHHVEHDKYNDPGSEGQEQYYPTHHVEHIRYNVPGSEEQEQYNPTHHVEQC